MSYQDSQREARERVKEAKILHDSGTLNMGIKQYKKQNKGNLSHQLIQEYKSNKWGQ